MINRIIWGVLLLLSAILFFFGNNAATLAVFAVVLILPLVSLLMLIVFGRKQKLIIESPKTALKNANFSVKISLLSKFSLPLFNMKAILQIKNILTGEKYTQKLTLDYKNNREQIIEAQIASSQCGEIHFTLLEVVLTDLFGIFKKKKTFNTMASTIVMPEVHEIAVKLRENTTFVSGMDEYSTQRSGFDSSEIFGLREYEPGDSIKSIHWKLSSKSDIVIVKEASLPVSNKIIILFESPGFMKKNSSSSLIDEQVEVFLSICNQLLKLGLLFNVGLVNGFENTYNILKVNHQTDYNDLAFKILSNHTKKTNRSVVDFYLEDMDCNKYSHIVYVGINESESAKQLVDGSRQVSTVYTAIDKISNSSYLEI